MKAILRDWVVPYLEVISAFLAFWALLVTLFVVDQASDARSNLESVMAQREAIVRHEEHGETLSHIRKSLKRQEGVIGPPNLARDDHERQTLVSHQTQLHQFEADQDDIQRWWNFADRIRDLAIRAGSTEVINRAEEIRSSMNRVNSDAIMRHDTHLKEREAANLLKLSTSEVPPNLEVLGSLVKQYGDDLAQIYAEGRVLMNETKKVSRELQEEAERRYEAASEQASDWQMAVLWLTILSAVLAMVHKTLSIRRENSERRSEAKKAINQS